MQWISFLLFLTLISCEQSFPDTSSIPWQTFAARNREPSLERPLIYRAQVPMHWTRQEIPIPESLADTTKPICEFYLDKAKQVRLTLYTFPFSSLEERIPPQAQVARWKKQLENLEELSVILKSQTQNGFSGLYFEGQGLLKGEPTKIIGWSMQLATIYARQLSLERQPHALFKQADYTLKVVGPSDLVNRHLPELLIFAQSFELIDELPLP